jgi:hypothetical protein
MSTVVACRRDGDGRLVILDQTKLPAEEKYLILATHVMVADAIRFDIYGGRGACRSLLLASRRHPSRFQIEHRAGCGVMTVRRLV